MCSADQNQMVAAGHSTWRLPDSQVLERPGLSGDLAAPEPAVGADDGTEFEEDIAEIQWHIKHLRERLCGLGKRSPLRDQARLMEGRLTRIESHLARSRGGDGLLQRHECSLRALYRTSALLQTGAEWHSPPGSLVHPIQDLTALSVLEGYNDYQRGYVEQLREVEEHLAAQLSLPADVKRRTLVFSSGMGAIHTALQLLLGQGARLLVGRRVYYETQALLEQWFHCCRPQLMPLDERQSDQAALTAAIGEADAVFLDTVTLDREGIRLAPERLFDAVRNAQKLGFSIVLDNTVLGLEFPLPSPPPQVTLVVVESLLKHYQGGLDLASAGALTIVGENARGRLIGKLETMRGTNGTNLPAFQGRVLPRLPSWLMRHRLRRQNRNARLLSAALPAGTSATAPGGGLLFVPHPDAARCCRLLELLALARKHRLSKGTSFGFNSTRFAVPPTDGQCLRFACGMEHAATARQIAATVRLACTVAENDAVVDACDEAAALIRGLTASVGGRDFERQALRPALMRVEGAALQALRRAHDARE